MTAVISTTYEDKYLWYLPLTVWAWNKIGVDVICFMPKNGGGAKLKLIENTIIENKLDCTAYYFDCQQNKEATYSQCSRLYAANLDLPEGETLITSDTDMLVFNKDYFIPAADGIIDVYGSDLVPPLQYPMCYLVGNVKTWRELVGNMTPQQQLDKLLGDIDCENMRGNYWGKDQEEIFRLIQFNDNVDYRLHERARPGTQFASKRYDRDDSFILDRLSPDTIDYHMNRPGCEENNFSIILQVLQYHYPNDNFDWLINYRQKYLELT